MKTKGESDTWNQTENSTHYRETLIQMTVHFSPEKLKIRI